MWLVTHTALGELEGKVFKQNQTNLSSLVEVSNTAYTSTPFLSWY